MSFYVELELYCEVFKISYIIKPISFLGTNQDFLVSIMTAWRVSERQIHKHLKINFTHFVILVQVKKCCSVVASSQLNHSKNLYRDSHVTVSLNKKCVIFSLETICLKSTSNTHFKHKLFSNFVSNEFTTKLSHQAYICICLKLLTDNE